MLYEIDHARLSELIVPGRSLILLLNPDDQHFSRTFGKMEFNNAMKVLLDLHSGHGVPIITVACEYLNNTESLRDQVMKQKRDLRTSRSSSQSGQYENLLKEYREVMRQLSDATAAVSNRENVFADNNVTDKVNFDITDRVIVAGFDTDAEVLMSATGAISRGILPIIVSDGVSSPSERLHFGALEIMSGFAEIVDSREIQALFEGV